VVQLARDSRHAVLEMDIEASTAKRGLVGGVYSHAVTDPKEPAHDTSRGLDVEPFLLYSRSTKVTQAGGLDVE
jgi:hypothetical protein